MSNLIFRKMNPDWRNEPAEEEQKEKLRFFGCTWDEGITAGQANDALEECAKQFPDMEAAYPKSEPSKSSERSSELPANETVMQHAGTVEAQTGVRREGFFSGESSSEKVGSNPIFILPTSEQLDEIRSFGKIPLDGLTYQEAKIWIEQCKILYSEKLRKQAEEAAIQEATRWQKDTGQMSSQADDREPEAPTYLAYPPEPNQARDFLTGLNFLTAYSNWMKEAREIEAENRRRYDNYFAAFKLWNSRCNWNDVREPLPLPKRSFPNDLNSREATIQKAAKPQTSNPSEFTIPARVVQEYPPRLANQTVSIPVGHAPQRLDALLKDCPSSDGYYWLPVTKAANLIQIFNEAEKITIDQSRLIAERIGYAGYCVEPDARFGGGSYDWNQSLGLFKSLESDSTNPSTAYLGAANLLRLCVLIAVADGQIDEVELDVFREVIENQLDLSQTDHQRLQVLEKLLVKDSSSAAKTLAKAAKSIPAHKRVLIGKVLVRVAAADRVIAKGERRALERIFKILEISPEALENLIRQACPPSQKAVSQDARQSSSGKQIPKPFALDMAKVYSITNETKEVVGILSVVMQDEQEDPVRLLKTVSVRAPEIPKVSDDGKAASQPTRFNGLDSAFHLVLERLLTRDSWPQADFNSLAREFHFMPLNIRDTLNEWADEALGDFILDGDDPVVIRHELIAKGKIYG